MHARWPEYCPHSRTYVPPFSGAILAQSLKSAVCAGSQPTGKSDLRMKRSLEDAADRAQKYRRIGLVRKPLDQLGFHPLNRGGAGIFPHRAHEVAGVV